MLADKPIWRLPTEKEMRIFQDEATATDFALLSGVSDHQYFISDNNQHICTNKYAKGYNTGIRPIMTGAYLTFIDHLNNCFERGSYPQWAVSKTLNEDLTLLHQHDALAMTGKKYSIPLSSYEDLIKYTEYVFNGKKYVRVPAPKNIRLSNGILVEKDDYYFVEVTPITWYYLEKEHLAISKHVIGPAIQGLVEDTKSVEQYLKKEMARDLDTEAPVSFFPTQEEILKKFTYIKERLKLMRINNPDLENELFPLIEGIDFLEAIYQKDKEKEEKRAKQALCQVLDIKNNFIPFIQRKLDGYIDTLENSGQFLTKSKKSALASDMEQTKTIIKTYIKGNRNRNLFDAFNE